LHVSLAARNSLPEQIWVEPDVGFFRKLLKTHLFNLAFNVHGHCSFQYVTLGMHLCSACYRRTRNALDADDDEGLDIQHIPNIHTEP